MTRVPAFIRAHASVEPGHGDLSRYEHLQVLNYCINGVLLSLHLSGKNIAGRTALAHLDAFLNDTRVIPAAPAQGLSKGLRLLERLCAELSQNLSR